MKVTGATSLEQFLAVKKAAEARLKKVAENVDNKVEKPAPAPKTEKPLKTEEAPGLLSVYNINRALGTDMEESNAKNVIMKSKHLGNFFDKVA